jgi:hypothetical protein
MSYEDSVRFPSWEIGPGVCALDLSTPEQKNGREITIYPNPTSDGLVRMHGVDQNDLVSVTAVDGRTLHVPIILKAEELVVDLSNAATGLYVVQVSYGQWRSVHTVLRH